MNAKRLENNSVSQFVYAGKAIFTLKNAQTGNRFTYKLSRKKSLKEGDEDVLFVKVLSRPDNNSDYTFIGTIFGKSRYRHSPKSPFGPETTSSKAIDWLVNNIDRLPQNIEVWHEGRCGRCGRRLTVPESIQRGLGPECGGY